MSSIGPTTLTVLGTYKCTAACKECCFECGPHLSERVSSESIISFIEEGKASFETLRGVVFSGGECFLLGRDLVAGVEKATELGLNTRCVSNGYWATSPESAKRRLVPLKEAGLKELNFSTGDDHQEFVHFEFVVNGAIQAAELGINVIIVVEGFANSSFSYSDAIEHPRLNEFMRTHSFGGNISIINNVWVPFYKEREILPLEGAKRKIEDIVKKQSGCDNILTNLVLTPSGQLAGCCGITMEHIPEMKIGNFNPLDLKNLYDSQFKDFMKIWLWVDGPEKIYHFLSTKDARITYDASVTHSCQACAMLYNDELLKESILQHWEEAKDEVLFRYHVKKNFHLKEIKIS